MTKRSFSILLVFALVAGVFSALPAQAQDAPVQVPATPNIVDDASDANGVTPQGGPAGGVNFSGADILAGWFTVDAESIYTHLQITAATRGNFPIFYRVRVDPGSGSNCLWITASFPQANDPSAPTATLRDTCGGDVRTPGEVVLEAGPEETGVVTIKLPRSAHAVFADGAVIKAPWAETTLFAGTNTANPQNGAPIGGVTAPTLDLTEVGTDYIVGSGGGPKVEPAPGPGEEPPGKSDPPGKGKKKGCKKGKGKKKGACPGRKPPKPPQAPTGPSCPAYTPGEEGKDAPLTLVTADATEDKPLEVPVEVGPGIPEVSTPKTFMNLQVDAAAGEAGLYVRYEFPIYEDHDIYLNYASGSEAAHAGGFNPAPVPVALGCCDGTGSGGHSEQGAEQLDGIKTADCAGYTLDLTSFMSEGGEMTLKLWLGEAQNDPAAPTQGAFETFMGMLLGR